MPGDALLIVDVQNDLLPGGVLPAPHGDAIIAPLNRCIEAFEQRGLPVYCSLIRHPTDHGSFRPQGGRWPPYCIAGLRGAECPTQLHLPAEAHFIATKTQPEIQGESAFCATGLAVRLRDSGCRRVLIGGLLTEHGIRATALDAVTAGFETVVLEDAVDALEAQPGDGARALAELQAHGVRVCPVDGVCAAGRTQ